MPLGGGFVVAISLTTALFVVTVLPIPATSDFLLRHGRLAAASLVAAIVLIVAVGAIDDRFGMRGRHKLFLQFVAAFIALAGCRILAADVNVLGFDIPMGVFGIAIPVLWVLTSINAFNLIDGTDGLASSIGAIVALTVGLIAARNGYAFDAILSFGLAGALLGFLVFNRQPASMYLGDAGSMLVGLTLGTTALRCTANSSGTAVIETAMLAVWSIPILDLTAAVVRRKLSGKSIYDGDQDHFHHRLLAKGYTVNQTVIAISSLSGFICIAELCGQYCEIPFIGISTALIVVLSLIGFRVFGYEEFLLLRDRTAQYILESLRVSKSGLRPPTNGLNSCDEICDAIVEEASRLGLAEVKLEMALSNGTQNGSGFLATWVLNQPETNAPLWQIDQPFLSDSQEIGRITALCKRDDQFLRSQTEFIRFIDALEPKVRHLVDSSAQPGFPPMAMPIVNLHVTANEFDAMSM